MGYGQGGTSPAMFGISIFMYLQFLSLSSSSAYFFDEEPHSGGTLILIHTVGLMDEGLQMINMINRIKKERRGILTQFAWCDFM